MSVQLYLKVEIITIQSIATQYDSRTFTPKKMTYSVTVLAPRKPGVSHETFKARYERHMSLVREICGDENMPLRHTRTYFRHDDQDKPVMIAGDAADMPWDCIVQMDFADEAAFARFGAPLMTGEGQARILADEEGFWDRTKMKMMVVDDSKETKQ